MRQTDGTGNTSLVGKIAGAVTTDNTDPAAPGVTLADDTGSSATDSITRDGKLTVTGTQSGDTVEYIVTEPGSATALAAKTAAEYETYIDATGRADGLYSVVVKVTDVAGNTAPTTKKLILVTTDPTPSVALANDTGSSGSDNITGDGRLTVTGVAPGDKLEYTVTKGAGPALVPKTEAEYANYIATAGSANYSVVVKVSDAAGNTASRTKTFTLNSDPVGKPTIDGTVKENETLTAMTNAISDADVLGTFSYQWQADGKDISGATSSSCKLTDADVDKKITVQVNYTDGQGMIEKVTSAESVEVVNVNTDPVGKPTINVQPSADEITCDVSRISDDDGLGIYQLPMAGRWQGYQWCDIGGHLA